MKRVLLSGNCNIDHPRISKLISSTFSAEVARALTNEDAKVLLKKEKFDLVIINRVGAFDRLSGLELVDYMQKKISLREVPAMITTDIDMYMNEAIDRGAVQGFGKSKLVSDEVRQLLASYLQ